MLRKFIAPALAATLVLAACESTTVPPATTSDDDFALVMFGEAGTSLENTMGPQTGARPYDGRSGFQPLPDSLRLTQTQRDSIQALRERFRAANRSTLDSLKAIFEAAKTARQGGATREEVRAILVTGRPLAEALRPKVMLLHLAIRAILTDAQRAWLEANRPHRFPPMMGPMPMGPRP